MMAITKHTFETILIILLWSAPVFSAGTPRDTQERADVGRALDRTLQKLTIKEEEIPAALEHLGRQGGISIALDDHSADLLPWGRQTKLKQVSIEKASLREVLPTLLGALGMTYQIKDDGLMVQATKPLKRMNRRATWADLKLLRRCGELDYTPRNLATFKFQYRITSKVDAPKMLMTQIGKAGRGTIAQILEVATSALGWVWFPNKDHLVIRTCQAQIANRMARRVTVRYEHQPLSRILLDLANRTETPIHFEPGMMLRLPATTAQNYTLLLQRTSIRQAFELISAETGLQYKIHRDEIRVGLSDRVRGEGGRSPVRSGSSPYIGKISIPSTDGSCTYDFLLREDELPDDIRDYRRQIIEEYIQKMRSDMTPDHSIHSSKPSEK